MIRRASLIAMIAGYVLWAFAVDAAEETIVAGLSENRVAITANFDGSQILVYGAVKREAPAPTNSPLGVIITVEGPATSLVIRRKEHVAGLWLNRSSVTIDAAPSFYAVATTGPVDTILSGTEDLRHGITLPHVIRAIGIASEAKDSDEFVEALQRIRLANGQYRMAENSVQLTDETLFRADVDLPANLTEGNYRVRIFLLRDGKVVDSQERFIGVRKAGMERYLFNLSRHQPLIYGFVSIFLAVAAGWAASAGFRYLRS